MRNLITFFGGPIPMRRLLTVLALLLPSSAEYVQGSVIWEQLPDVHLIEFVDQEFPDEQNFSTFNVNDATLNNAYLLESMTTYFTAFSGIWDSGITNGRFNVFSKTGSLPGAGDDPSAGTSVPVSITLNSGLIEMTADLTGLNLVIGPGTYWFGLTPIADLATFGQEFHSAASGVQLDNAAARNPGGGFGVGSQWFDEGATFGGTDWDSAFSLSGTLDGGNIPEPTTFLVWSLLGLAAGGCWWRRKRNR